MGLEKSDMAIDTVTRRICEMRVIASGGLSGSPGNGSRPLRLTRQELDRLPILAHGEFDSASGDATRRIQLLEASGDSLIVKVRVYPIMPALSR